MKKVLLAATLGFSVGIACSHAQSNFYSANIVGYVNVTNGAGQYVMMATPLDNGTNDLSSLLPNAPNGSQVFIFTGGTLQPSTKSKGTWSQNFVIPPGTGFFLNSPFAGTNTFVGTVAGTGDVNTGLSNEIDLQAGVTALVGSPIPFSGTLADVGPNTINLGVLPNGTVVYRFINGGLLPATKSKGIWNTNLTINPGNGFYVNCPITMTIPQNLKLQ
jgi:hypothetical protein